MGTIESTNGTFSVATFNTADVITPSGTNKIALTIDGTFKTDTNTALNAAVVSGVQTLEIRNVVAAGGTGRLTVDAANFAGLTTFNASVATGLMTVTNLASGGTYQITGNGVVENGNLAAGYVAAATVATLNVVGGTKGTGGVALTGTGLTSTIVNSTGAANTIGALAGASTATSLTINATTNLTTGAVTNAGTTVTVTGAGAVNLSSTALETGVVTVNASANTGGLTVKLSDKVTMVATGGSGNDVITSNAILTTGSVNAGAGTDTLVVGAMNQVNTSALGAKYTGFETLRFNGAMDATFVAGITTFQINGTSGNALSNIAATGQSVVVYAADATSIGATTLAAASGTANTIGMTFGYGGTATTSTNTATRVGALTLTGFSTLNGATGQGSLATAGAQRTAIIDSFSAPTLTAVNLTGTAFTLSNIATTLAVAINGSALTGNGDTSTDAITGLTVAGDAVAGSVITGSALRDSFTLGTASASTYNGGAGNDFFSATNAQIGSGASDPTLTGGDGTDTLNLTGTQTLVDSDFAKLTGFEKIVLNATTAVSVSGLTTNANAAFSTSMTVTGGTTANGATYAWDSSSYTGNVTLTNVNAGDGLTAADAISVTTGAGTDTVTITAASWVGSTATGAANGTIVVSTGSGVDTISVATSTLTTDDGTAKVQAVTITGGTGADLITATHVNAAAALGNFKFVMANGDSTITAYDQITGFLKANGTKVSDQLDFASVTLTTYATTAVTGYSAAQLSVAVSSVGAVTFAGTAASTLTLAQKIAAVSDVVNINAGDTAYFTNTDSVGVISTFVFNNQLVAADNLVQLVGVSGATALITTNANTDLAIFVA